MSIPQLRAEPKSGGVGGDSQKGANSSSRSLTALGFDDCSTDASSTPGERLSVQVGCLAEREAIKKRLEPRKATASRGPKARRKMMSYAYIEYWFHWKEQDKEGQWRCRSCYLGGHPKGHAPAGKLVARLDTVVAQHQAHRPYGETLVMLGMGNKLR